MAGGPGGGGGSDCDDADGPGGGYPPGKWGDAGCEGADGLECVYGPGGWGGPGPPSGPGGGKGACLMASPPIADGTAACRAGAGGGAAAALAALPPSTSLQGARTPCTRACRLSSSCSKSPLPPSVSRSRKSSMKAVKARRAASAASALRARRRLSTGSTAGAFPATSMTLSMSILALWSCTVTAQASASRDILSSCSSSQERCSLRISRKCKSNCACFRSRSATWLVRAAETTRPASAAISRVCPAASRSARASSAVASSAFILARNSASIVSISVRSWWTDSMWRRCSPCAACSSALTSSSTVFSSRFFASSVSMHPSTARRPSSMLWSCP
mmetsp:Transcript_65368/g.206538  ORF Transcript_65368/g.206538 Transcript_65368/m.206538 type:complete len:333 (-) Transcript_65368:843-1841(-)